MNCLHSDSLLKNVLTDSPIIICKKKPRVLFFMLCAFSMRPHMNEVSQNDVDSWINAHLSVYL